MDMAATSLFKHKVRFSLIDQTSNPIDSFPHYKGYHYRSDVIDHGKNIGVNHTNEVSDKTDPILYYIFSTMQHYGREVEGLNSEWKAIIKIHLIREKDQADYIIESWRYEECDFRLADGVGTWHEDHPRSLIYNKFSISVEAFVYFYIRPRFIKEKEEYTPPVEPHREDCCVACLEAKPNILYLDCLHIVICDSCDRLNKTGRKNCDTCRAEISRRIAL